MSLNKIIEKIQQEAQQKAQDIIHQAEEKAEKIRAGASRESREQAEQIIEKAVQAAQQKGRRMVSSADLAMRKEILAEKQQAIQDSYQGALQKLYQMPDKSYREIIKKMLIASYDPEITEVIFSEKDSQRINQGFIDLVNKDLHDQGQKEQLHLSRERRVIAGGFILKSDRVEIDNSFPSVLKYQESELESEVARMLFGEL